MYPIFSFHWGNFSFQYTSESLLFYFALIISFLMFYFLTRIGFFKTTVIFISCVAAALLGSRLLHLVWELKIPFKKLKWQDFQSFEGMVLYGGIFLGMLVFAILTKVLGPSRRVRMKMWDVLALITCIDVVLLRLGCFVQGCCWGGLCAYKWAVRYTDDNSAMPLVGIPVHPVQLYESGLCLLLFVFLGLIFYRKKSQSKLFEYFMLGYSLIRFFTEFFRGDNSRGVDLWLGLSTSQIISLVIFSSVLLRVYLRRDREKVPVLKLSYLKVNA